MPVPDAPREGDVLNGRVSAVKDFGVFVTLPNSATGMVHISELSGKYVKSASDFVSAGDEVTVKVLGVKSDGRISLSMKACEKKPPTSFEDLMSAYKKSSDERINELKRYEKRKR